MAALISVSVALSQAPQPKLQFHGYSTVSVYLQGGAKNWATGHPISLQIFRKLYDRIA